MMKIVHLSMLFYLNKSIFKPVYLLDQVYSTFHSYARQNVNYNMIAKTRFLDFSLRFRIVLSIIPNITQQSEY